MNQQPEMMMVDQPIVAEQQQSSPQSVIDSESITHSAMTKNKKSLNIKLLMRRPIDVLVDQGILPPPKSSPSFYEQKQRLERAKTGDYLKHKIQRRPQRDELVQQNILEQEIFDPSYYEQERKLKRARLADDLNERLSHRPGPLELIKGNILHADLSLEQAIKEGQITFKKTCEGEIIKNPPKRFVFEEESSSDSSIPSPSINNLGQQQQQQNRLITNNVPSYILSNTTPSASLMSISSTIQTEPPPLQQQQQQPSTTVIPTATVSYIMTTNVLTHPNNSTVFITTASNPTTATIAQPNSLITSTQIANNIQQSQQQQPPQVLSSTATINNNSSCQKFVGPSSQHTINSIQKQSSEANAQIISQPKSKSSKKIKSKSTPKTRVIKFHEYTGPPSSNNGNRSTKTNQTAAGWTSNPMTTSIETSYELLLKQQQLILQWQLESQQQQQQQQQQQNSTNQQSIPAAKNDNHDKRSNSPQIKSQKSTPPMALFDFVDPNVFGGDFSSSSSSIKNNGNKSNDSKTSTTKNVQSQNKLKNSDLNCQTQHRQQQSQQQHPQQQQQQRTSPIKSTSNISNVKKIISKLEDMKVSDLKAELKKRNLPVSGAKQQLIERLKPFSDSVVVNILANANRETLNLTMLAKNAATQPHPYIFQQNVGLNQTPSKQPTAQDFVLLATTNPTNNGLTTEPVTILNAASASNITMDGRTTIPLTIPIGQTTFIPTAQYQFLSSSNTANSNVLDGSKYRMNTNTISSPAIQLPNNFLISGPAGQTINDSSNTMTILTSPSRTIQLAQLADSSSSSLNFGSTFVTPTNTAKLFNIGPNSSPMFHQLLLYPSTATTTIINSDNETRKQQQQQSHRSNSFPADSLHPLQRNTSLPLIINQMPIDTNIKPLIKMTDNIEQQTNKPIIPVMKSASDDNFQFKIPAALKSQDIKQKDLKQNKKSSVENSKPAKLAESLLDQQIPNQATVPALSSTNDCDSDKNVKVHTTTTTSSDQQSQQPAQQHPQPDSTSNLDFDDFILNFDDLNGLDDVPPPPPPPSSSNSLATNNKLMTTNSRENGLIDFNDNWLLSDYNFSTANDLYMQQQQQPPPPPVKSTNQITDMSMDSTSTDQLFEQIFDMQLSQQQQQQRQQHSNNGIYNTQPSMAINMDQNLNDYTNNVVNNNNNNHQHHDHNIVDSDFQLFNYLSNPLQHSSTSSSTTSTSSCSASTASCSTGLNGNNNNNNGNNNLLLSSSSLDRFSDLFFSDDGGNDDLMNKSSLDFSCSLFENNNNNNTNGRIDFAT